MKLKVRGLVFSGFAAAVFAQSALAAAPVTPPEYLTEQQQADLKKTATSQYYGDDTYQQRQVEALTENSAGDVTEKAVHVGWKYGQGSLQKEWVKLEGKKQLTSDGQNTDTEYVEIVHDGKGQDGHYVQMNTASITTEGGSGDTGADKIAAAGEQTATGLEKGRLTTAKAVYDFVTNNSGLNNKQDKLTEQQADAIAGFGGGGDSGTAVAVGQKLYNSQTGEYEDSNWAVFGARANGSTQGDYHLSYLELQPAGGNERNKYWIDVKSNAIANNATAISDVENATGADAYLTEDKLTTAKAVYDFVTAQVGDAQRKVANSQDEAEKVMIGYRSYNSTTQEYGDSTWKQLQGVNYVTVGIDSETHDAKVGIDPTQLADEGSEIASAASISDTNLTTAWAVKEYVQSATGGIGNIPSECYANANVHCALVTSYVAANGTTPAHAEAHWEVMAQ